MIATTIISSIRVKPVCFFMVAPDLKMVVVPLGWNHYSSMRAKTKELDHKAPEDRRNPYQGVVFSAIEVVEGGCRAGADRQPYGGR